MHDIKLILTGAADGLPDYEFRLASVAGSVKSARQSRFTFNLPYIAEYIEEYYSRENGELQLYIDDVLWKVSNPDSLKFSRGANSGSINIIGTKQVTYNQELTLNVDERVVSEYGNKYFSVAGFLDIIPGDIIKFSERKIKILEYSFMIQPDSFIFKLKQDEELTGLFDCYPSIELYPDIEIYPCTG